MSSVYNSELHTFVEGYFTLIGAQIIEKYTDFFNVAFGDGRKEKFTYSPKVAGENKDVKLLAKGSRYLREMVQECSSKAAFSAVKMSYSSQSVYDALRCKSCCDLCPFITICGNIGECCDFCYNFKNCKTHIENGEFIRLGETVESKRTEAVCFIFTVELSNDYSLSQKMEKNITVLIDLPTGKVLDNVLAKDLVNLDMESLDGSKGITEGNYHGYLKLARQEAENILREQLDVFKKEIEGPLKDKITAILSKSEEDYIENYTKISTDELDHMQEEALKLCEREIRGYTINSSFHLKNAIILQTSRDIREMIFKLTDEDEEVAIKGEIFLSRIDIKCSRCGMEIDKGVLCGGGHVLCRSCNETCCECGKIICDICDHETYLCETCGQAVCSECVTACSSCGAVVCHSHGYRCSTCGDVFCMDCHEMCNVCETNICNLHMTRCTECDEPACPEHTHTCGVCGKPFCNDHMNHCTLCQKNLCENHSHFSAFSNRTVCTEHKAVCAVCEDTFAADEIGRCIECQDKLCPTHVKNCSKCGKIYCGKHINHCRSCGKEVCSCTPFVKCKLCGEEFCTYCTDHNGYCNACSSLSRIDRNDSIVRHAVQALTSLEKYKNFFLGTSKEVKVLYGKGLFNNTLIVLNESNDIISTRDVTLFEDIMRKLANKHGRQ